MLKMTPDEFFTWLSPVAAPICHAYGLPASVCMAQAAIESGWGEACIGQYNLFGRKAVSSDQAIFVRTTEFYDGIETQTYAGFKQYSSLEEAIEDWCILITQEPVYASVNDHLESIEEFVSVLAPIYATDPYYAEKVLATIRANDLTQYDTGVA